MSLHTSEELIGWLWFSGLWRRGVFYAAVSVSDERISSIFTYHSRLKSIQIRLQVCS
jgi:hypothetical protein